MANRHMKRYMPSVVTKEMQTKATVRYHCKPTRMGTMKKMEIINASKGMYY
jgi:hypothetical protein